MIHHDGKLSDANTLFLIANALAHPIDSPRLRDLGRGSDRVTILFDDNTRATPVALIVPWLLEELAQGGGRTEITFLAASGTHRPMTSAETKKKLGPEVYRDYPVLDHRWNDPAGLVDLGLIDSDSPVRVNRLLLESDLVIGIGHVVPHRVAGFSGGSKIVQPGVNHRTDTQIK